MDLMRRKDLGFLLVKLIPPRPSFALDMTDEERQLMQQHGGYWSDLAQKGVALIFGPVLDPAGSYEIGVVAVERALALCVPKHKQLRKVCAGLDTLILGGLIKSYAIRDWANTMLD